MITDDQWDDRPLKDNPPFLVFDMNSGNTSTLVMNVNSDDSDSLEAQGETSIDLPPTLKELMSESAHGQYCKQTSLNAAHAGSKYHIYQRGLLVQKFIVDNFIQIVTWPRPVHVFCTWHIIPFLEDTQDIGERAARWDAPITAAQIWQRLHHEGQIERDAYKLEIDADTSDHFNPFQGLGSSTSLRWTNSDQCQKQIKASHTYASWHVGFSAKPELPQCPRRYLSTQWTSFSTTSFPHSASSLINWLTPNYNF